MTRFRPSRAYQPGLDIRLAEGTVPGWAQPLVQGWPPNAECWLVVMGRRAGKTWLASGIARTRGAESTRQVDLRANAAKVRNAGLLCLRDGKTAPRLSSGELVLVDEPALAPQGRGGVDPAQLASGLAKLRAAGAVPVVFATPLEHALLMPHLGPDASKDMLVPPALDDAEIDRLTARAPGWASETAVWVRRADESWLRTPFLLELVLHVAEEQPRLRRDIEALLQAAVEEAERGHAYLSQLFHNGLAAEQRADLRAGRWHTAGVRTRAAGKSDAPDLLSRTGVRTDPVLACHLPEILRIHHISDLHHGGDLRATVDAKDTSQAGKRLAKLAGAGTPLDSYVEHVRQLGAAGRAPHLVILTGDVVNRPDDQYGNAALRWLTDLGKLLADHPDLRPADPRIVLVGGNHDVAWEHCLAPEPEARHRWFADTFADYPHPDLHRPECPQRRVFIQYPGVGLRIALLGSAESGGEAAHDESRALLERYQAQFSAADDEAKIRQLVNQFERLDPGIIARGVLDRLTPEEGYVTLAALHHPLSPVPSVEVSPYSGIVNAGQAKRALVAARTALALHGHTHLAFLAAERLLSVPAAAPPAAAAANSGAWTLRIAGAATLASAASDEQNGYNEVFLAREGRGYRLVVRAVRLHGGQWTPEPGIAFRPGAADECSLSALIADASQVEGDPGGIVV
jgi:hypothetical protein